jgi:O-antigen ligase
MALTGLLEDNPLFLPVLLYATVYILATLLSLDRLLSFWGLSTSLGTVTVLSAMVFFLLIASAFRSKVQVDRLIAALLVGSVPVSIYGWVQYLGLDPLNWSTTLLTSVHSTVGYSLFLGAYLAMVTPFTLSRIIDVQSSNRKHLFPYILILILQIGCLIFTFARGAWLGLMGGCLLFLLLLAYRWRKWRLIVFSAIALIAGSYIFFSMNKGWILPPPGKPEGLSDTLVVQTRAISNNERIMLWRYTLPMIPNRFLLGYGPETFSIAFWQYYSPKSYPELAGFRPWDPHNLTLYHLTATGILGLLAFLWILTKFFKTALAALQYGAERHTEILAAAILSSATAFLIQAQFNPIAVVPMVVFWIVLALSVSINRWKETVHRA